MGAIVSTEERRSWEGVIGTRVGAGVGHRYELRRRGTFQMGADVSRTEVSEREKGHFGRYMMDDVVRWMTAG